MKSSILFIALMLTFASCSKDAFYVEPISFDQQFDKDLIENENIFSEPGNYDSEAPISNPVTPAVDQRLSQDLLEDSWVISEPIVNDGNSFREGDDCIYPELTKSELEKIRQFVQLQADETCKVVEKEFLFCYEGKVKIIWVRAEPAAGCAN